MPEVLRVAPVIAGVGLHHPARPPRSVDEREPATPRRAQTQAFDAHPHAPGRFPMAGTLGRLWSGLVAPQDGSDGPRMASSQSAHSPHEVREPATPGHRRPVVLDDRPAAQAPAPLIAMDG